MSIAELTHFAYWRQTLAAGLLAFGGAVLAYYAVRCREVARHRTENRAAPMGLIVELDRLARQYDAIVSDIQEARNGNANYGNFRSELPLPSFMHNPNDLADLPASEAKALMDMAGAVMEANDHAVWVYTFLGPADLSKHLKRSAARACLAVEASLKRLRAAPDSKAAYLEPHRLQQLSDIAAKTDDPARASSIGSN